ncbi:kinase-like protein [Teratosphaeria nubilosa]|uniref:non-specific serine/threonine protein kinase n=1 Tax=Teratosphaeria nubilosa TaxID=161662 RepID=A0A6G1KVP3_9PEZI|nr:kinase-like protein [Teratosphaeria nubilosa]
MAAHGHRPFDAPTERLLNAEQIESDHPGGLHSVDIGDTFHAGRYRIVRKLGHGSSSTVWLAQDTRNPRYVAIKILSSEASKACKESAIHRTIAGNKAASGHIVRLLDDFKHHDPNGEHLCLVFEPMGPDIAACAERSLPYWQRRSISKSLLLALQCLHDLKLAHDDTNPGNALLSLTHPIEEPSGRWQVCIYASPKQAQPVCSEVHL